MLVSENNNFSDETFPHFVWKRDLICVKEDLLRKSPNSLTRTFLNANIKRNKTQPSYKEDDEINNGGKDNGKR